MRIRTSIGRLIVLLIVGFFASALAAEKGHEHGDHDTAHSPAAQPQHGAHQHDEGEEHGMPQHDDAAPSGAASDQQEHMMQGQHHRHARWDPPPPAYANKRSDRWTDPTAIARGKQLFMTNCLVCHGPDGRGTGPAAKTLPHPPADLTNHFHMKLGDGDAYLFWRVSEGGLVEPFKSMQSVMPAFKTFLSEDQRWDVLAYVHATFHKGFKSETMPTSVAGEGTVIAVVPASEQIVVEHGDIAGFMDAMTMGYAVNPPSLLDGLNAGDHVRFTIDTQQKTIVNIETLKE